jgi:hypothetical protein
MVGILLRWVGTESEQDPLLFPVVLFIKRVGQRRQQFPFQTKMDFFLSNAKTGMNKKANISFAGKQL